MDSLQWALSRLVLVAVGLAPMLVYWAAGLIGPATRRRHSVIGGEVRARSNWRESCTVLARRTSCRH
jgi:hypothetical protein